MTDVPALLADLQRRGLTLAVAESLTGGRLADAIVSVPGASAVFRGGVVAYATDVKRAVLGVDGDLLAEHGAIHPEVARQMAEGVCDLLGADVGLATTGAAGPDPQDGHAPGEVYIAVAGPGTITVERLDLDGDRPRIRAATVDRLLALASAVLASE